MTTGVIAALTVLGVVSAIALALVWWRPKDDGASRVTAGPAASEASLKMESAAPTVTRAEPSIPAPPANGSAPASIRPEFASSSARSPLPVPATSKRSVRRAAPGMTNLAGDARAAASTERAITQGAASAASTVGLGAAPASAPATSADVGAAPSALPSGMPSIRASGAPASPWIVEIVEQRKSPH
jgi:hypothetical protein